MVILYFMHLFLICISFVNYICSSENVRKDQLKEAVIVSSSKLFEDGYEYEDDELENIFITQTAKRYFLALQDSECLHHEDSESFDDEDFEKYEQDSVEKSILIDDDYFLIGNGLDIECVTVNLSQLSIDNIHKGL